jgi:hypothetical protein
MFPPAPARFSTTTDCPHASVSFCARRRATTSVAPPAANGTIILTGFAGHACANATRGASRRTTSIRNATCFIDGISRAIPMDSCKA